MIENHNKSDLERKIDLYVNGELSTEEIEDLWAELIQDEYHLDYLKSVANLKAVIERKREQEKVTPIRKYWQYAAAAVIALLMGVLVVLNYPVMQTGETVQPIESIELDYYRSTENVTGNNSSVIRNAISMANRGQSEEAVNMLRNELDKASDPNWIATLSINLGSIQYNSAHYDQAAQNFERATELQSNVDQLTEEQVLKVEKAYWFLGNAYFQMNQLAKAEEAIRKAYEFNGAYRRVAESYLKALSERTSTTR